MQRVTQAIVLGLGLLAGHATAAAPTNEELKTRLVAIADEMADAITYGDRSVWQEHVLPEALISDEDGNVLTKGEMLEQIRPLPEGYVGNLDVAAVYFRREQDAAVLSYDLPESLTLYGQTLHTRFRATDVFLLRAGKWRLFSKQIQVIPAELPAIAVPASHLQEYVGNYWSANEHFSVTLDEGRLLMSRGDGAGAALIPIAPDRFVVKGQPRGERFFRRDAERRIVELVHRRDNLDLVWEKR